MTPHEWKGVLEDRGLHIVAVTVSVNDPATLIAYLNGSSGQWVNGEALRLIKAIPGVVAAAESPATPTIIRMWVT